MSTTMSMPAAPPLRPVLPSRGIAKVKSVLSGDTVVLLGKATVAGKPAPEVLFTFERVTAPRMASKANGNIDDPAAFPAREWLRTLTVGKSVAFETRKQGASAGDRVYGLLFMPNAETGDQMNLAVESVRRGFSIPKVLGPAAGGDQAEASPADGSSGDPVLDYEHQLQAAFQEAVSNRVGVHGEAPLVRKLTSAGEGFETLSLIERVKKVCDDGKVKCVIEYVFDGSRCRCLITDPQVGDLQYGSFTLLLAGVSSPRVGNPRLDPPTESEPFAVEAKSFVELRLLHRELDISLHGTDKGGICAVGTVHHPRGNISVELLKNGLARMSDWSVRIMNPLDVPALRIAENGAKRANIGIWHSYSPPVVTGDAECTGTVVEVSTGDTLTLLPAGAEYDDESKIKKFSLSSIRAPRVGNEKYNKPDEPYSHECKDRLRVLVVGKSVKVVIDYERDIPMGQTTEKRQFGTVSVGKRPDVGEVLLSEGLAVTQRHRDDDEKSSRYDDLLAAESMAKAAGKGVHSTKPYGRRPPNDLTEPRKAKAYSGSLMRAGTVKAIVEHVFNGSRFKLLVPTENCNVVFSIADLRCPQPSPVANTARQVKAAEPFGDESKRHSKLTVHQRQVEISCSGVTAGGVITGQMWVGQGGQRRDFGLELVGAGLAVVDQRKIDYGEAPKVLVDAQAAAQANKVGVWSIARREEEVKPVASVKSKVQVADIQLSEIRSGSHFFYHVVGDEAPGVIDESMKQFTSNNGTDGAPCDVRNGKIVAALFDDGTGKSWYRAKILEKQERGRVKVLFVDHGNVAVVVAATHLRPLDAVLDTNRIPAAAKEAELALTLVRSLDEDEGVDAARMLQSLAWGKTLSAQILCSLEGKAQIVLMAPGSDVSVNEQLVSAGLGRLAKKTEIDALLGSMMESTAVDSLVESLGTAQDAARKSRAGMWRYGDVGDDDEDM